MGQGVGSSEIADAFDRHGAALVLYARQWCDPASAEDIVQEAFVALAGQRSSPDNHAAWLHRVVRNRAISWARKRKRREHHEHRAASQTPLFSETDERLSPEDAARLVDDLPADCREAVVARIWGGLGFDEVARLMGCSLSTAHRRYHEGLTHLQQRMNEPCPRPLATRTN